jgi:hypothetical protein
MRGLLNYDIVRPGQYACASGPVKRLRRREQALARFAGYDALPVSQRCDPTL